jgi:DNA-binding transcriptional LysR family regulator
VKAIPFVHARPSVSIRVEVVHEDSFIDVVAGGFDAGLRYDDRVEQDMIAVPIGPRVQRTPVAASPAYLDQAVAAAV